MGGRASKARCTYCPALSMGHCTPAMGNRRKKGAKKKPREGGKGSFPCKDFYSQRYVQRMLSHTLKCVHSIFLHVFSSSPLFPKLPSHDLVTAKVMAWTPLSSPCHIWRRPREANPEDQPFKLAYTRLKKPIRLTQLIFHMASHSVFL